MYTMQINILDKLSLKSPKLVCKIEISVHMKGPRGSKNISKETVQYVYTSLFYQTCDMYDISVFGTSLPMQRGHDILFSNICA